MRKLILAGLAIGLSLIAYTLFRPLIVWPLGWQKLPEIQAASATPLTNPELAGVLDHPYDTGNYPSLSAAISINGKVVWTRVRGYADLNERVSAPRGSQYRIGSRRKTVNAHPAGLLAGKGRLDLDPPLLASGLPAFQNFPQELAGLH